MYLFMSGDLYGGARDDPTPHILSQFEAPMDSNELVSFLDCPQSCTTASVLPHPVEGMCLVFIPV